MSDPIWCSRRSLQCAASACVSDWRQAQTRKPFPWESRWHCRGCGEGAQRAGVDVVVAIQVAQVDVVLHTCTRCHRPAERIVRRFCVPCYNREQELLRGYNGKGTPPVLLQARYPVRTWWLRFRDALGRWQWLTPVERAADALEAMLALIRRERAVLMFARPVPAVGRQLSFWGGV